MNRLSENRLAASARTDRVRTPQTPAEMQVEEAATHTEADLKRSAEAEAGFEHMPDAEAALASEDRSLFDDVAALIDDGRTYLEAELVYQQTRAAFAIDRIKRVVIFGAVAAFTAVLACIGLVVGLIFALIPYLTAWGATAAVVCILLVAAFLCVRIAARRWKELTGVFSSGEKTDGAAV